jgi:predicted ATPase
MKVVIAGRTGTDKTEVARAISLARLDMTAITEQIRNPSIQRISDPRLRQEVIVRNQLVAESRAGENYITARGLHDVMIFSRHYVKNFCDAQFGVYSEDLRRRYDAVFVLAPTEPFSPSPNRTEKTEGEANEIQRQIENLYGVTGHNLIQVSCPLPERVEFILEKIKGLEEKTT